MLLRKRHLRNITKQKKNYFSEIIESKLSSEIGYLTAVFLKCLVKYLSSIWYLDSEGLAFQG